ncbi:MAG: M14 family zinc carboxypeptidase [Bacteroidales bacterium]|nr:M14 family zinc carboxypeptidase [Bacteroidales bacterium]
MNSFYKRGFVIIILVISSLTIAFAEKHHRVVIDLAGREVRELAGLGIAMDIAEFRPGHSLMGEFSETELRLIENAGFRYEILIEDMTSYYQARNAAFDRDELNRQMREATPRSEYPTPVNFTLGSMGGFHTYDEMLDDLDLMVELFPDIISVRQPIGTTTTIQGRPVYWVRISNNPGIEQDKPKVLYTALTHAREPASMQQMLFQMWYILENYDSDPEIQYLVDHIEMYFVPCVNPDGYIFCETTHPNGGSMHRKNMRQNYDGSIGVDLNRNFGYKWGHDNWGSSPNPPAQTYRGMAAFSEPETQLQKQLAETYNFSLALNNHTFSDLLIYPWGYANLLTPDAEIFSEYAKYLTRENNYVYGTVYETLNYLANGVSDDWFYGEQTTKDKVFAFTPEAGKPSDGFWPAMDRIEEICAGHTHMNLGLARLALPFAEATDLSPQFISENSADIEFSIINFGQVSPASFTVSLIPLSDNITGAGESVHFTNMGLLDTDTAYISLELSPSIGLGQEISFVLSLDNGSFAWNDTLTKFYGEPLVIFHDPCDNLDQWTSSTWGISNQHYFSPPGSIADSPGQNYPNNAHTFITTQQAFDLSTVSVAWIEFHTRYQIEANWDYVQFMYSTDNQETWTPLAGNYTVTGGNNQDTGKPLYHGSQQQWVKEEVDLSHLIGHEEVWFRFRLVSDHIINMEGFYFDDFKLIGLPIETTSPLLSITFTIINESNEAIEEATITVNGTTYEAGEYVIDELEPGTYTYTVTAPCYLESSGQLTLEENTSVEVVLMNIHGDANDDGQVNILDIITVVNHFTGVDNGPFCFYNADVNQDGTINVLDIIGIVSIFSNK